MVVGGRHFALGAPVLDLPLSLFYHYIVFIHMCVLSDFIIYIVAKLFESTSSLKPMIVWCFHLHDQNLLAEVLISFDEKK